MSKSIDEDITNTLVKLCTLIEYSTSPKSDEVWALLTRAKAIWEGEVAEEEDWTEE